MNSLEEGDELRIDFSKLKKVASASEDVIPVAIQHEDTKEVILLAYTTEFAFKESLRQRSLILWSTSRNELWEKGKTSGETFELIAVLVNCEQNSLVYRVRPRRSGICHTKNRRGNPRNCYYRTIDFESLKLKNMDV